MTKKLTAKQQDKLINQIYGQYCSGMQISVLRLSALFGMARKMLAAGESEAAIGTAMAQFITASQ